MRAIALLLLSLLPATVGSARSGDGDSLLGKSVTNLTGTLDQYVIKVIKQPKEAAVITPSAARHALEHSEFIDPTLREVRTSGFPWFGTVSLTRTNHIRESFVIEKAPAYVPVREVYAPVQGETRRR
jgi:hypothetical protein